MQYGLFHSTSLGITSTPLNSFIRNFCIVSTPPLNLGLWIIHYYSPPALPRAILSLSGIWSPSSLSPFSKWVSITTKSPRDPKMPDTQQRTAAGEAKAMIISNTQHLTEPNLMAIAQSTPQIESLSRFPVGQKRKNTSPDISPGVGKSASHGLRFRPLAKRPTSDMQQPNHTGQSSSSSVGAANIFGMSADAETWQASPIQGTIPVGTVGANSSGHLLTGNASSGSIPMHGETITSSHSVGGEDNLAGLNYPAPYAWGVLSSVRYPYQSFDFGYAGAEADITDKRRKLLEQEWTGGTGSPFLTHAWRSHLELITSLAVAISQISRKVDPFTNQPLGEVDVEKLLQQSEKLQQSYFKPKECVQQSMPSSGGESTFWMN